jgi:hypothetical protein
MNRAEHEAAAHAMEISEENLEASEEARRRLVERSNR